MGHLLAVLLWHGHNSRVQDSRESPSRSYPEILKFRSRPLFMSGKTDSSHLCRLDLAIRFIDCIFKGYLIYMVKISAKNM